MRPTRAVSLAATLLALATLAGRSSAQETPALELTHDGVKRPYLLHVPSGFDKELPLVFCLHGGGGTAEGMPRLTRGRFDALADKEGFLVCYPDGIEKSWNDGRATKEGRHTSHADDVGFIASLIDAIARDHKVDRRRVYATGMSNGGFMSYRLGVDLAEAITAVAPVCANLSEELEPRARAARPLPLLAVNGTKDPLVPFEGGDVHVGPIKRGRCLSTARSIEIWCARNHAAPEAEVTRLADRDASDETHVRREVHKPLEGGAPVELLVVEGGGHTWPGGQPYLTERIVGKTSHQADACDLIWEFFKRHSLPAK
jgi:polyhydroxybutyrate depolymerase